HPRFIRPGEGDAQELGAPLVAMGESIDVLWRHRDVDGFRAAVEDGGNLSGPSQPPDRALACAFALLHRELTHFHDVLLAGIRRRSAASARTRQLTLRDLPASH